MKMEHPPQGDRFTDPGNCGAYSEILKPEDNAGDNAKLAVARQAAEEGSLGKSNRPQDVQRGEEKREGVVCSGEADAAVGMAVESRAKMVRFSGGLEGGAGKDGENFECEFCALGNHILYSFQYIEAIARRKFEGVSELILGHWLTGHRRVPKEAKRGRGGGKVCILDETTDGMANITTVVSGIDKLARAL